MAQGRGCPRRRGPLPAGHRRPSGPGAGSRSPTTRSNCGRSYDAVPGRAVNTAGRCCRSSVGSASQSRSRSPTNGGVEALGVAAVHGCLVVVRRSANSTLPARSPATGAAGRPARQRLPIGHPHRRAPGDDASAVPGGARLPGRRRRGPDRRRAPGRQRRPAPRTACRPHVDDAWSAVTGTRRIRDELGFRPFSPTLRSSPRFGHPHAPVRPRRRPAPSPHRRTRGRTAAARRRAGEGREPPAEPAPGPDGGTNARRRRPDLSRRHAEATSPVPAITPDRGGAPEDAEPTRTTS